MGIYLYGGLVLFVKWQLFIVKVNSTMAVCVREVFEKWKKDAVHDGQCNVPTVHFVYCHFPIFDLDWVFSISDEDDLASPRFLVGEVSCLGFNTHY